MVVIAGLKGIFALGTLHCFVAAWSERVQLMANGLSAIFLGGCHVALNLPAEAERLAKK
jgi:hypothetical protein